MKSVYGKYTVWNPGPFLTTRVLVLRISQNFKSRRNFLESTVEEYLIILSYGTALTG
jgi:hypothetical protein